MSSPKTLKKPKVDLDTPWNVVVYDDPVNMMDYVTWAFIKIFSYPEKRAEKLMMEVHECGRSVVWSGKLEQAELYTQQLQALQLTTGLEKPGEP